MPFPPPGIRGPFSLDRADVLAQVLRDGALENVSVQAMFAPMRAASLQEWWERVPKLAGPLAMALAGMETDVRAAIRDRALAAGAEAVRSEETAIVFEGCVLIASGRTPDG